MSTDTVTVVGNDGFSDIAKMEFESGAIMFFRLTNCCKASAKGVEYGTHVACRACYATIDPEFGDAWGSVEELRQWVDAAKEWAL
jgi:hypothetical protein